MRLKDQLCLLLTIGFESIAGKSADLGMPIQMCYFDKNIKIETFNGNEIQAVSAIDDEIKIR